MIAPTSSLGHFPAQADQTYRPNAGVTPPTRSASFPLLLRGPIVSQSHRDIRNFFTGRCLVCCNIVIWVRGPSLLVRHRYRVKDWHVALYILQHLHMHSISICFSPRDPHRQVSCRQMG